MQRLVGCFFIRENAVLDACHSNVFLETAYMNGTLERRPALASQGVFCGVFSRDQPAFTPTASTYVSLVLAQITINLLIY